MRKDRFLYPLLILNILLLFADKSYSQDSSSSVSRILSFPDKVFGRIDKEASSFEQKLNRNTEKYLNKLQRQEERLKHKLWKQDSTKAKEVFGDVKDRYDQLRNTLHNKEQQSNLSVYSGHLDSLTTAMNFLQSNPLLKEGDALTQKVTGNIKNISSLKNSLNQTDYIRKQIAERQQQLKAQLQNIGLAKEFRKYRKEVFYYQQQVREYKEALEDPKKLGARLLTTAQKIPAFQKFFDQNSQLASLFRLPGNPLPNSAGVANTFGLQTRFDVQNMIQQRIGTGPEAQQYVQQQIQTAQNEFQKLKSKVNQLGNGSGDMEMPDFKTNSQKTKSFLKRIEWGTNLQTTKGTYYFPVTSDIGVSAGFKLNDKSIIGIGGSYKLGWGQNWQNIHITNQGVGIRTFIDWKAPFGKSKWNLLKSLWISGGAEMNYRSEFKRLNELYSTPSSVGLSGSSWQQSALVGISKKYNIGKKWKGNAQLMYDFLWKQQRPQTQPVVFRIGYHF